MKVAWEIAKFKTHLVRVWSIANIPVQLAQLGVLVFIAVKTTNSPLLWLIFPVCVVLLCAVWWFDVKYLLNAESDYAFRMSPGFKHVSEDIAEIKKKIDAL